VENWRDINFEEAWNRLKGKYRDIEWWDMAAAVGSIAKTPAEIKPILQVDACGIL
jgi:hypothetical protein